MSYLCGCVLPIVVQGIGEVHRCRRELQRLHVVQRVDEYAHKIAGEKRAYKRNLTARCGLNRSSIRANCEILASKLQRGSENLLVARSPNIANATLRAHSFWAY